MGNYHKNDKGKLPLFFGNGEQVIPIYAYIFITIRQNLNCNTCYTLNTVK